MKKIFFYIPAGSWSDHCIKSFERSLALFGKDVGLETTGDFGLSDYVFIGAGSPLWADVRFDTEFLNKVYQSDKRVIVGEQHEYGWSRYSLEDRVANASLLTGVYRKNLPANMWKSDLQPLIDFLFKVKETGRHFIYFKREFFNDIEYPDNFYPFNFIDFSKLPPLASLAEFADRKYDLVCIWGHSHPHRGMIADALRDALKDKTVYLISPATGKDRVAPLDFISLHSQGRCFISTDGHGLGDGRIWTLPPYLAMFRKDTVMKMRDDYEDKVSMVSFSTLDETDKYGNRLPDINDLLVKLNNYLCNIPELYSIYRNGYFHHEKFFTPLGYANYLKNILDKNENIW